ncbi:hypothetical protein SB783_28020 [Paraburkholderia sp. SIMBA_009]|uniref:Uncharacterized protein n=1 Tax=Paraburkholderia tropica TaxID=92647 RepID=A0AAQ1JY14_9BURK|nr:hypothetical protein [Paraburkholderia tropica]SEK14082.1 hypothetical protein SAMN05216550_12665 [Paraburkholderia tropica]
MIKCSLFSNTLGHLDDALDENDTQVIVIADTARLKAVMESNDLYYLNPARIDLHARYLDKDMFEMPLVVPTESSLRWIEGFHQINAAANRKLPVIPVTTSAALAERVKALVGASSPESAHEIFEFSGCHGVTVA